MKVQAAGLDSLNYIGHSFVEIKTADGKHIYIDPYNVDAFTDSADVVLITHEHSDHNELFRVKQKSTCTVIRSATTNVNGVYKTVSVGNITVKAVPAYNTYHLKDQCVGYIVEFDGIKLYHAGDTGKITEMADLTKENLDYALLPMDGIYTMGPEEATLAASVINAKHDMSIHTMPPPDSYRNAIVARFTSPNKLVVKPGSTFALDAITSVGQIKTLPATIKLNQNYPNPFNPSTIISYSIPSTEFVALKIFNALGHEVKTLVNRQQKAGDYQVRFDGKNLSSGVYFCRLITGNYNITRKIILQK
jgi:L-ascorbate metabolism protein UlaG (beta-lactamase superfamily)